MPQQCGTWRLAAASEIPHDAVSGAGGDGLALTCSLAVR